MSRWFCLCVVIFLFPLAVHAQNQPPPECQAGDKDELEKIRSNAGEFKGACEQTKAEADSNLAKLRAENGGKTTVTIRHINPYDGKAWSDASQAAAAEGQEGTSNVQALAQGLDAQMAEYSNHLGTLREKIDEIKRRSNNACERDAKPAEEAVEASSGSCMISRNAATASMSTADMMMAMMAGNLATSFAGAAAQMAGNKSSGGSRSSGSLPFGSTPTGGSGLGPMNLPTRNPTQTGGGTGGGPTGGPPTNTGGSGSPGGQTGQGGSDPDIKPTGNPSQVGWTPDQGPAPDAPLAVAQDQSTGYTPDEKKYLDNVRSSVGSGGSTRAESAGSGARKEGQVAAQAKPHGDPRYVAASGESGGSNYRSGSGNGDDKKDGGAGLALDQANRGPASAQPGISELFVSVNKRHDAVLKDKSGGIFFTSAKETGAQGSALLTP
jgi:hypothetical protein